MTNWSFTLIMESCDHHYADNSKTMPAAFFHNLERICNDMRTSTLRDTPHVHFARDAKTLSEAIRSAIRDVKAAGLETKHVEIEPDMLLKELSFAYR